MRVLMLIVFLCTTGGCDDGHIDLGKYEHLDREVDGDENSDDEEDTGTRE